jgi:diketogulonate reductase-like aldo/keto reductase
LIHWPETSSRGKTAKQVRREVWGALEELYRKEKVRSIGVSNFTVKHLSEFFIDDDSTIEVKPMINQFERHPRLKQQDMVNFCQEHGVQVQVHFSFLSVFYFYLISLQSYQPLGNGYAVKNKNLINISKSLNKGVFHLFFFLFFFH